MGGFVLAQIARSSEPLGLDQGLFACFGRWLRDGWLPYRDIFDSKPPLHLYTWVVAWAGGSVASAWWFEAIWLAATMVVGFVVARHWWGRWAGLAAATLLFVGLWSPGLGGYWSRLQAEELLVLPELGAAWFAIKTLDKPRAAIACGALTGVVGLYKIPALAVGGAWLALWLASMSSRDVLPRIAWFVGGVVAPWLVAGIWFAAHGALAELVDATLFYQRHWIKMIDPPLGDVIRQFATTAVTELAPLWLGAIAGIVLAWRRERARAICLLTWIVLTMLAVVVQRQLAGYHFLLLVPGLALASAYAVVAFAELTKPVAAGFAMAALLALALRGWPSAYGATDLAAYRRDQFSPADEVAVAQYIVAHTQPRDGILVWALAPGIYALADRHPTTRFPFHRLLLTDARLAHEVPGRDARRAALLDRMRSDPPAYIVLGIKDANPFEPDSFTSLMAFRELHDLVQRDYHDETSIGRFVLLVRTR